MNDQLPKFCDNNGVCYVILPYYFTGWLCRRGGSLISRHTIFSSHSGVHRDFPVQCGKADEALLYFLFCDIRLGSLHVHKPP